MVILVEEEDEEIMLAALVMLQKNKVKKRLQKKRVRPGLRQQILKLLYKDFLDKKNNKKIIESINEEDNQLAKFNSQAKCLVNKEKFANSRLSQTRTIKQEGYKSWLY